MIDHKWYEDQAYQEFKDMTVEELKAKQDLIHLYGSNGKGQTAIVPMIRINVIDRLIKEKLNGSH